MNDEPEITEASDPDGATMAPPPPPSSPPPPPPAPTQRRLVRDPYSKLGGVASGVAHYYGLDVSLVRILFVLFAFLTGFGFLLYLVAWLVIPRATYWPPVGPARSLRSLSGRDLGLGLALVGLMFAVGVGSGGVAGNVLIPLLLVGGGVWLLVQPPSESSAAASLGEQPGDASAGSGATMAGEAEAANQGYDDDVPFASSAGGSGGTVYGPSGPAGAPVPPPSSRRRWGLIGIVVGGVLFLLAIPALIIAALVAGVASGEFDLNFDQAQVRYAPATVAAIPDAVVEDGADLVIDLTSLDAADFDSLDAPVPVDADVDIGSIRVVVPEDLDVAIDASVDVGTVSVFGEEDDGFDSSIEVSPDNGAADVDLDLVVGLGEITVERP